MQLFDRWVTARMHHESHLRATVCENRTCLGLPQLRKVSNFMGHSASKSRHDKAHAAKHTVCELHNEGRQPSGTASDDWVESGARATDVTKRTWLLTRTTSFPMSCSAA